MRRGHSYSSLRLFPAAIKRLETALQIYLKLAGDVEEDELLSNMNYVDTLIQLGHVHYAVSLSLISKYCLIVSNVVSLLYCTRPIRLIKH